MTTPDAPETAAPLPSETAGEPSPSAAAPAPHTTEPHPVPEAPVEPPAAAVPEPPGAEPTAEALEGSAAESPVQAQAPQAESPLGPASHAWPPPVSAGPYRTPPHEPSPYAPRPPRPPWAVVGPSLRVFAVLLWSYVVVGQFTSSWPLGRPVSPAIALALVFLLTLLTWVVALRTSHAVAPPASPLRLVGRGLAIAAGGFALFLGAVVAPIVGAVVLPHMRGYDFLVGFALVSVSLGAALLGEHISHSPDLPRRERTHAQRFVLVLAWVGGALLTLVAGVDLAGGL